MSQRNYNREVILIEVAIVAAAVAFVASKDAVRSRIELHQVRKTNAALLETATMLHDQLYDHIQKSVDVKFDEIVENFEE